ncbi:MAG: Uma2 family endonuclease [Armatimonadota bacterium]
MAEAAARLREITLDEAARLDPDTEAGEVVEGVWAPVTRNSYRHGEVVGNATFLLTGWARTHSGWRVAAGDPGTRLGEEPATLLGPDVAVYREERRPSGRGRAGWLDGAPEVAVEILGDTQSMTALLQKGQRYLGAGALLVWVLDPEAERVVELSPPNQLRILGPEETLEAEEVLPDFSCRVAELFV